MVTVSFYDASALSINTIINARTAKPSPLLQSETTTTTTNDSHKQATDRGSARKVKYKRTQHDDLVPNAS
jgi:hypothetical protein